MTWSYPIESKEDENPPLSEKHHSPHSKKAYTEQSTRPPRKRPERVLADKAYSSRANRAWLVAHHIRATIPLKADQAANRARRGSRGGRPPAFDPIAYKDRNTVERCFGHLKQHRAFATRYDKLAMRYQATTHIASINHWLKRLT